MIQSNHIPTRQVTHKLENNYATEVKSLHVSLLVTHLYFSQINIKENFKALLLRGRTKFKIKWKEKLGNKIALGC